MLIPDEKEQGQKPRLIERAGVADAIALSPVGEEAWIDVIQKMDSVYAELVEYQVELEYKNAALEEAQKFIGSVLADMTDVLIVCDNAGRIQRANLALESMIGRSEQELLGRPIEILLAPQFLSIIEQLYETVRNDQSVGDFEVAFIDKQGVPAPLAMNCSARYDHKGRFVGLVLIGRPVGELRRAYKELNAAHQDLRQAQQQLVFSEKMAALGRLVAGVAHELNNPISFVFGNMHALKRYGARLTQYLQAIDRGEDSQRLLELRQELKIDRILADITPLVDGTLEGAERVSEIVQDLRRFSSSQTEPMENFNLTRVIRTAVSWVEKTARVKPEVTFQLPDQLEVSSRRGPVHQIMVNLVQNAVDVLAACTEPRMEIAGAIEGSSVVVHVRDNGPGITPAAMKRLFEPFFTTKPIGEGTGLGLYVSYGLAEELGGQLEAGNHPEGGAVFSLRLPLKGRGDAR